MLGVVNRLNKNCLLSLALGFPGGASGKTPACLYKRKRDMGSIPGRSPGGGHGNPIHNLAWKIPWTEEPGRLQSIGLQRVRHNWSNLACTPPQILSIKRLSKINSINKSETDHRDVPVVKTITCTLGLMWMDTWVERESATLFLNIFSFKKCRIFWKQIRSFWIPFCWIM